MTNWKPPDCRGAASATRDSGRSPPLNFWVGRWSPNITGVFTTVMARLIPVMAHKSHHLWFMITSFIVIYNW